MVLFLRPERPCMDRRPVRRVRVVVRPTARRRCHLRTSRLLLSLSVLVVSGVGLFGFSPAPNFASSTRAAAWEPVSWVRCCTLLTLYGRGFATAPGLGSLGQVKTPEGVQQRLAGSEMAISRLTRRPVRVAIHVIYGLAAPCAAARHCLLYLDDTGVNIVSRYILPARRHGWLVILDDQLGSSTPEREMRRLIRRGYLRYDNVEVAFDPEFRSTPGQREPGQPVGFVTGGQINRAAELLDAYARQQRLRHQKLLLVHRYTPEMVRDISQLRTRLQGVKIALIMDGIGPAAAKAGMYRSLMHAATLRGLLPGIKLFPASPYDPPATWDRPLLSWEQIFGGRSLLGRFVDPLLRPIPRVIVMT